MTTREIWLLEDKAQRLAAFLERYLDLDERTGNRTLGEKDEMLEIATAVMPTLIRISTLARDFCWEPENWEAFQDLKTSISNSLPAEFVLLARKIEEGFGGPKNDE